jgi:intein/homing endonuclease
VNITPEIAEISGAFAADGSMQHEHLCMWGHITEDREYYDEVLAPMYERNFGVSLNVHEKKSNSVYGFYMCTPKILKFFWEVLEFTPGCKTYTVRVPKIIRESKNPDIWAAFVRGYADCDGCLSFGKRYSDSYKPIRTILHMNPTVSVSCVSEQMIIDVSKLLTQLEIQHTVHTRKPKNQRFHRVWKLQIVGKRLLKIWIKKVGFSNHAKLTRYKIYLKHGYCPPKTTSHERRQIINGKRCPLEYYTAP